MDFQLTPQRVLYIESRGKIVLKACPGSGKTTSLVHKVSIIEKECLQSYGQHAGIACLSFTNVAKDEILNKYKLLFGHELSHPHHVSTIDSFINHYITLPFFNLLDKKLKRPIIVDEKSIIDNLFKIKYRDKNGNLTDGFISSLLKFKNKAGIGLYHSYPPSSIWVDVNGQFSFEGKKPSSINVDPSIFQEYAAAIFKHKIRNGLITSLDSSFIALHLIGKYKRIAEWLIKRFPFFIIDEAQDNSEIQHAIFDTLISLGLENVEMIGDPYQSLYEWRDAKPQLFQQKFCSQDWNGLILSQNRRSVQRIIDCFSILRSSKDESITSLDVSDLNIPIVIYKYTDTNHIKIIQHFEEKCLSHNLKTNQIVVRGNTLKDKLLGNAKSLNPWKTYYPMKLLQIKQYFQCNQIKTAVDELRKFVIELLNFDLEYDKMKELQDEMKSDYAFNGKLYSFLYKIPVTSTSFLEWTTSAIENLKASFNVDVSEVFEFKKMIKGHKMNSLKLSNICYYFNKPASTKHNIPITSIHQVKGATLDALLYFFDEGSNGQSVSFNDFIKSKKFPNEKQRIVYVACSRPKQFLAMAFPITVQDIQLRHKFGNQIEIVDLEKKSSQLFSE